LQIVPFIVNKLALKVHALPVPRLATARILSMPGTRARVALVLFFAASIHAAVPARVSDRPEPKTHTLIRCSWGSSFIRPQDRKSQEFYPAIHDCGNHFCESEYSTETIGEFMFYEAASEAARAAREKSGGFNFESKIMGTEAQCMFLTKERSDALKENIPSSTQAENQEEQGLCSCIHLSFIEYCKRLHFNTSLEMHHLGDSTMAHLKDDTHVGCQAYTNHRSTTTTTTTTTGTDLTASGLAESAASTIGHDASEPEQDVRAQEAASDLRPKKKNAVVSPPAAQVEKQHVVIVNERTLHYLYLPFAREIDRPAITPGVNTMLLLNISSVQHYLDILTSCLLKTVRAHPQGTIFVYMPNNEVCPDQFSGKYENSWRFLIDRLDLGEIQEIATRRHSDITAGLGFTLDYYGSAFASTIARAHVKHHFPGFLHLPTASHYPAACVLTNADDGRHFGAFGFRLVKARLILNLVKSLV
jgi:hypothetical protein